MAGREKLSTKFQIAIPSEVRATQQWQAGQEFVFIPKGKGVMVMPAPDLVDLAGIARGDNSRGYRERKDRA
ncbi:MAG: AbrB/MazE/SpoVT family DNA-binding domain-containing protein [Phreatobacter sp.]